MNAANARWGLALLTATATNSARCQRPARLSDAGDARPVVARAEGDSGTSSDTAELSDVLSIGANIKGDVGCALRADGSVWCWGMDACFHAPERQTTASRIRGVQSVAAVEIALGPEFSCARLRDSTASCWLDYDARQPAGTTADPIRLPGPAVAIAIPGRGYARLEDGRVMAWHSIDNGGDATIAPFRELPELRGDRDGVCERRANGTVRCQGTPMAEGGHMSTPTREVSDPRWREAPTLANAEDLGSNDYCGWGIVAGDLVRTDCVYCQGCWDEEDMCSVRDPEVGQVHPGGACTSVKTARWQGRSDLLFRTLLEYHFPQIEHLVSADVGIDRDGRCFYLRNKELVSATPERFLDMVGYRGVFYGLTRDRHVRQFCSEHPEGVGTPVVVRP